MGARLGQEEWRKKTQGIEVEHNLRYDQVLQRSFAEEKEKYSCPLIVGFYTDAERNDTDFKDVAVGPDASPNKKTEKGGGRPAREGRKKRMRT
jgi:hypothetical protein